MESHFRLLVGPVMPTRKGRGRAAAQAEALPGDWLECRSRDPAAIEATSPLAAGGLVDGVRRR